MEELYYNINEFANNIADLVRNLRRHGIDAYDKAISTGIELGTPIPHCMREQIRAEFENNEENVWQTTKELNTIQAYQDYLASFPSGNYREEAREAISVLTTTPTIAVETNTVTEANTSDNTWLNVDKTDMDAVKGFIIQYPDSPYYEEALRLLEKNDDDPIKELMEIVKQDNISETQRSTNLLSFLQQRRGKGGLRAILDCIKEDHNFIGADLIKDLIKRGEIKTTQLIYNCNIDREIVDILNGTNSNYAIQITDNNYKTIDKLVLEPSTEVYFWGIPASGKSCALGAILSVANNGDVTTMEQCQGCQGYSYMTYLSNIFQQSRVGKLPEGNPIKGGTYEMAFTLVENETNIAHPITCIDLPGELLEAIFDSNAGLPLRPEEVDAMQTMNLLFNESRTPNKKLHFFVIPYNEEKRLWRNLPQNILLDQVIGYIDKARVFSKDTDGIYILVTKADRLCSEDRVGALTEYVNTNYKGLVEKLKKICRKNEINEGRLGMIPFTVGDVYFNTYCKLNETSAKMVINELLKTEGEGRGRTRLGGFLAKTKKQLKK
ncbi:MAG: hypothetical protein IKA04_01990 [Alistipes sp.]|nr:hypothetical protein [Alistipes sp.]